MDSQPQAHSFAPRSQPQGRDGTPRGAEGDSCSPSPAPIGRPTSGRESGTPSNLRPWPGEESTRDHCESSRVDQPAPVLGPLGAGAGENFTDSGEEGGSALGYSSGPGPSRHTAALQLIAQAGCEWLDRATGPVSCFEDDPTGEAWCPACIATAALRREV